MLIIAGVYLVIGGLIGVGMSVRSALAQARYAAILFGRQEPEAELLEARRSFRLDPHHYSMCIRAAETAFRAGETAADPERADAFMREAAYWVGRGLELNPWLIELRYLDACLRARESPVAGAAAWKAYVDWHFWNPDNLEHLARFQQAAGQDADALETLEYLRPWSRYDDWRNALQRRVRGTSAPSPAP